MVENCLAFIEPLEPYQGVNEVLCSIRPVTGKLSYRNIPAKLGTGIFNYYFWGTTFEVVKIDVDTFNVYEVRDILRSDFEEFNLSVDYAITYNHFTHDVLGSAGFLHNLDQSLFARHCKPVLNNIYVEISRSYNFAMRMYLLKGALISIVFDRNISKNSVLYKYVMQAGFVAADKDIMRKMIPKTTTDLSSKEVMKQEDIDKLLQKYVEEDK